MNKKSIFVDLKIDSVIKSIKKEVEDKHISCIIIDKYKQIVNDKIVYVLVLEKYYIRIMNKVTATVVIDDFEDKTRIYVKAGGGFSSYFVRYDWGAAKNFEEEVYSVFEKHIIE